MQYLDSHGMSSLLALQGYIHRLSWEQQACRDWWHPFQMASLEWYHSQMGIQPWKQFTPMALCHTRVRRAGKKPHHPETSGTAVSLSFLDFPRRRLFLAPYQPGTETHLAGGWGVGKERQREYMHDSLSCASDYVLLCSPEPFSSRDFAPSLHRSSAVCRYQLPLSPSGPCVADQIDPQVNSLFCLLGVQLCIQLPSPPLLRASLSHLPSCSSNNEKVRIRVGMSVSGSGGVGAIWVACLMHHRTNEEETTLIFVSSNF